MADLFSQSISYLLFLGGAVLLLAEAFAPGAHLFVLGVALLTAGLVGLFLPSGLGILAPLVLAAVVLAVTGLTLWGYRKVDFYGGEGAAETTDSSALKGRFGHVTERVTERDGEIKLEDGGFNPYYRARSVDGVIEEGTEVMVVDPGGGNVVTVSPLTGEDDIDRELARERERTDADRQGTDSRREVADADDGGSDDRSVGRGDERDVESDRA